MQNQQQQQKNHNSLSQFNGPKELRAMDDVVFLT